MPLFARTLSLNVLYNWARDVYANPKGFEHELLSICCITKTMMGWNLERVASVGRERCGGQSYLSINRFGELIALAHSALTAEGDNAVLMVKICKDMLTNVAKHGQKLPQPTLNVVQTGNMDDVSQLDVLVDLLRFRERTLFERLANSIKQLTKEGKSQYNILMRETSNNMQDLAMAYGERLCVESCLRSLTSFKNAENKKLMTEVFRLFAIDAVKRELGFYLISKAVNAKAAKTLLLAEISVIKSLASKIDALLEVLNVPKHALYVPIAADFVEYYAHPNYGEVHGAKL